MSVEYIKRLAGPYVGDGTGQKTFSFGFLIFDESDVYVAVAASSDSEPSDLQQGTDYTVSMNADQSATPGGTITLTSESGLAKDAVLVIGSAVDYTQTLDLTNYTRFAPERITTELDRIVVMIQQIVELLGRVVQVPPTSSISPSDLFFQLLNAAESAAQSAEDAAASLAACEQIRQLIEQYSWDIPHIVDSLRDVENYPYDGLFVVGGYGNAGGNGQNISNRYVKAEGSTELRTLGERFADIVNVRDFGAVGDGVTDDTAAFVSAARAAKEKGGALVYIPSGVYRAQNIPACTNVHFVGAGKGSTEIKKPDGSDGDVFISEDFYKFTGVGSAIDAPHHFSVKDLTVNGNYLTDWQSAILYGDSTVSCSKGYGFRLFGTCYDVDVELINCPEVGFYSEAIYGDGYYLEHASSLRLQGRVFGKEAVIYRGPGDCELGPIFLGAPGYLPTQAERNTTLVMSDVFPGEPVHCFVSDESLVPNSETVRYSGHHEFTTMHLYGNANGYGYFCNETARLKGNHLICEGCRGGFCNATRTWGQISILECHNNIRRPLSLKDTIPLLYDIHNKSLQNFTADAVIRHVTASTNTNPIALYDEGRGSSIRLNYSITGTQDPEEAYNTPVAEIHGSYSKIDIVCQTTKGNAVVVDGACNDISVVANGHTGGSLVKRLGGDFYQNINNKIKITANNCSAVYEIDKLVTTEKWDVSAFLREGQTLNGGSTIFDMYNRATVVDVTARMGDVSVCSRDTGRVNLDNTTTEEQTITVNHIYFQTPDVSQIKTSIYDPDPSYSGRMEYLYVSAVTDRTITFRYKLSSMGSGGPLVLLWEIM